MMDYRIPRRSRHDQQELEAKQREHAEAEHNEALAASQKWERELDEAETRFAEQDAKIEEWRNRSVEEKLAAIERGEKGPPDDFVEGGPMLRQAVEARKRRREGVPA
jgi:molecular chaperone GrpE (heat shock protein)